MYIISVVGRGYSWLQHIKEIVMTITHDGIGYVVTNGQVIRRYCNFTRDEAIADFKAVTA